MRKQLLDIALKFRKITKNTGTRLIINDRLDIAMISDSDGIHSPADGMPAEYIKKIKLESNFLRPLAGG